MWQPLARARRHLTRGAALPDAPGGVAGDQATDLTIALNRIDLERLIGALAAIPGIEPGRADTPARLEAALRVAIAHAAGRGTPTVTRRPAGIYTPETWQIEVHDADARTRTMLEGAIHTGGLA